MAADKKSFFTLAEFADRFRMSHSSALTLVYSGAVRAMDVSSRPEGRSRFLIPADAVEEFEARRAVNVAPPAKANRRRRNAKVSGITEFIQ